MRKTIQVTKKYLRFPICVGAVKQSIEIFCEGKKVEHLSAELCPAEDGKEPDFYGEFTAENYIGKELLLDIREIPSEEQADAQESRESGDFEVMIDQSDDLICDFGKERYPAIHFTPKCGWLNDPNGLTFYDGKYHLFYQHNAYSTVWNEISWGHAVSTDLLHWTHLPEAIIADAHGTMFSGSGIINHVHKKKMEDGTEHEWFCPACPKDSLMLFYTNAGQAGLWSKGGPDLFDQRIAYSTDGIHFTKLEEPVLPHIVEGNRDPKVYWNEEACNYYMVLFLSEHDYGIFVSEDLLHWEQTQTLTIQESWECPDLVKLPMFDKDGEKTGDKWLFWTPDSFYLTGDFDGRIFTPNQEVRKLMGCGYKDRFAYAAQSFNEIPGRAIQLPWILTGETDRLYNGIMGLPREMKLMLQEDGSYVLSEPLTEEVTTQQILLWSAEGESQDGCSRYPLEDGAVHLTANAVMDEDLFLNLGTFQITWSRKEKQICITGLEPHPLEQLEEISVVLDKGIAEISCNRSTVLYYALLKEPTAKDLEIRGCCDIRLWKISA